MISVIFDFFAFSSELFVNSKPTGETMKLKTTLCILCLVFAANAATAQESNEFKKLATKLVQEKSSAIVTIRARTESKGNAFGLPQGVSLPNMSSATESSAIVVDESGMFVCPYSSIDNNLGNTIVIRRFNEGGEEQDLTPKSEFKSVDIILFDGTRLPGKIVLVDKKLDIAVVAASEEVKDADRKKMSAISLGSQATVDLLDRLIFLERYSDAYNAQVGVTVTAVAAVVEKPRTSYVVGDGVTGRAAFDKNGEFVGLGALKRPDSASLNLQAFRDMKPVVLPAKYIRSVVEQAKKKVAEKDQGNK